MTNHEIGLRKGLKQGADAVLAMSERLDAMRQERDALKLENASLLAKIASQSSCEADRLDAARWRETLQFVGGKYTDVGAQRFTLRFLCPRESANIMHGSVAEHFTNAIDDVIAQRKSND